MTGNEARTIFLDYFKQRGHQVVRSASLIPQDDPTLLFVNAGMVPFKRTFLGEEKRDYVRATGSQKCVRASGKHNDLENVGYTARHHTFFEMLGNFSFGDYFKEKAIAYSWDLIINGYGLPAEKLWVSIYREDDEAHDIWRKEIGVPEDRIVRLGEEDNFWSMGDTGPCGPCSEIHIDRGVDFGCGRPECTVGCECDRYLEFWNLVFMESNRDASGKMTPLPNPSIDTGLGLERMASILQDVPTNYDTDLLMPMINRAADLSEIRLGASPDTDVALKVIADHSRTAAFLIGDGILPSNEGRGYVLRRIMRRAIRYGRNIGLSGPFLFETVRVVGEIMRPAYPELKEADAFITNVIKNEETRFFETLDNGLKLLNDALSELKADQKQEIPGDIIFKLYDTYGFPADIVRDVIRDQQMTLDMDGYNEAMEKQRSQSRSIATFSGVREAYKDLSARGVKPEFVGYEQTFCEATVLLLVRDDAEIEEADSGTVEIVTDRTPFYGASGGQAGDVGTLSGPGFEVAVSETLKDPTGIVIHRGEVLSGKLEKGAPVTLTIDRNARDATARNHTATHILHAALRQILGDHVKQAGSLVEPNRLRFDFTHFSQVNTDDLNRIEDIVNEHIRGNSPVHTEEMAAEDAFKSGATALFEEKYGDRVRVVSLAEFSKELCGGTHTRRTGDIGLFKILGESSIASGVRRIEALTGERALSSVQQASQILQDMARLMKEKPATITRRVEKLIEDHKSLEREVDRLKAGLASLSTADVLDDVKTINGVKVLAKQVAVDSAAALRDLTDQLRDKMTSGIIVLGAVSGSKVLLVVAVTKDLTDRYHAGKLIKRVAALVGGGGGRPDMAQAGGTRPEKLSEALDTVYDILAEG
ncbi:MAG: alanine--tRNA ligase [Desulfobacterales bacterium]